MSAVILAKGGNVKAVAANVQLIARAQNAKEQHANALMVVANVVLAAKVIQIANAVLVAVANRHHLNNG